jgi:hypothetical protein
MLKWRLFRVLFLLLVSFCFTSFSQEKPSLKYLQVATIESSNFMEETTISSYKDTLTNNLIYLRKSKTNIPLYYYKTIQDAVCFDNVCRMLDIIVYWNITGRYLGFELPKGEFLSKQEHDPFSEDEYLRLHTLLADASIPLDAVSFEKLVEQPKYDDESVDAVSGATSKSVAEMVVKGAAYTTYKLWNIVNGPTMNFVSARTEKQLTPRLINQILQSSDNNDKLWALHRIDSAAKLSPDLEASLLNIIASDDFSLAYNAIQAIVAVHLNNSELQDRLFSMYSNVNHSIKKELVKKLMQAPILSSKVVDLSRDLLDQLNGQQLDDLLKLYSKHGVNDLKTCKVLVRILENKNKYISKKAYNFLIKIQTDDEFIMECLKAYKNT